MPQKENKTKSFILRVDADTLSAVEAWAADEFRSTNGQLQWIISEALRKSGRLRKRRAADAAQDAPQDSTTDNAPQVGSPASTPQEP